MNIRNIQPRTQVKRVGLAWEKMENYTVFML
jgi:hypothetical protein